MMQPFRLFGPTCDRADRMEGPFLLPADMGEGDWIEIGQLGAYGAACAPPSTASTGRGWWTCATRRCWPPPATSPALTPSDHNTRTPLRDETHHASPAIW